MLSHEDRLAFMRVLKCLAQDTVIVRFDKTSNCWVLQGSWIQVTVNDDTGYCGWHHVPFGYMPDIQDNGPITYQADCIIGHTETRRAADHLMSAREAE